MTKKEFIKIFTEKALLENKAQGEKLFTAFLETLEEGLLTSNDITFIGWGKFELKDTPARVGRNPKTGEEVQIPAKKVIKFKAGKALADKVNK